MRLGSVGDVMTEGFGEQLVGGCEVFLAMTEQHAGPVIERGPGRFSHQSCLAQAGLARDQQNLSTFPRRHALGGVGQQLQVSFASDYADCGAHGESSRKRYRDPKVRFSQGFPQHLDCLERVGDALQSEFPERPTGVGVAATGHGPYDIGGQDLPFLARCTEPGRLDDRVSKIVVVFAGYLSPAESNPQAHRVFTIPIVELHTLLHAHGTGQGG